MISRSSLRSTDSPETNHVTTVNRSIDDIDTARWNELVDRNSRSTLFHRTEWLRAVEVGLGADPYHLTVHKDGNLVGLLPQFKMPIPKTPFYQLRSSYPGFGGPVIGTDHAQVLDALLETSEELCGGRTVLHEIRACDPEYLRYHDRLRSRGYRPARYKGRFMLNIDRPYEAIVDDMARGRRRGIERGRSHSHSVDDGPITRDRLARFYRSYREHMRDVDGNPYPFTFFEELSAMEDDLLMIDIQIEGRYAGGFLELLDRSRSHIHGFFFAIPSEFRRYNVPELMYDHVIRWGIDHGYDAYDFGGAVGDFTNGVFQFKQGFGGNLMPNLYWERGFGAGWPLAKTGRSLYFRGRS